MLGVLGVLAVPPARLEQAAPTATRPWAYFAKYGIAVRAGSPAVLITVPETWRHRAGIGWGNNLGVVSSLRLLSCPRQPGAWNVYAENEKGSVNLSRLKSLPSISGRDSMRNIPRPGTGYTHSRDPVSRA